MARSAILESNVPSLVPSLEPVEALRGEQTQLESWVHQSFTALERLHSELNEWQQELTKKQDQLDHNQSARSNSESDRGEYPDQVEELQKQLEQSQKEVRQLEEELADQAQEYEELEHRCTAAQAGLKTVRKYSEQLSFTLESERQQESLERQQWNEEMKEIRSLMERQCSRLETKSQAVPVPDLNEPLVAISDPDGLSDRQSPDAKKDSCDEIRRRAKKRRAANCRKRTKSG